MRPFLLACGLLLCHPALAAARHGTTAEQIIARLQMQKIPDEGAWFAPTYRSPDRIAVEALPPRYHTPRDAGSAIYALITRRDFSAMHRLITDETWHFYAGDPIELLLLWPDGRSTQVLLGSDVLAGQQPQFTVPAGTWMGARPQRDAADAYSLFGCTLAPGFDYGDYQPGYRDSLQRAYPKAAPRIAELTRSAFRSEPAQTSAPQPAAAPEAAARAPLSLADVPAIPLAPGVKLRELIGRSAAVKTDDYSLAHFSLAPGAGTGMSYNRHAEEFFVVVSGHGTVTVDGVKTAVANGSIVVLKAGVRHALTAAGDSGVEFYAVTMPAFSPDDYVRIE
jgi:predicted cupin superfamily sugar epimerase/mannose-6-phosphate isomerase-like protein (cupin superfamily)